MSLSVGDAKQGPQPCTSVALWALRQERGCHGGRGYEQEVTVFVELFVLSSADGMRETPGAAADVGAGRRDDDRASRILMMNEIGDGDHYTPRAGVPAHIHDDLTSRR